MIPLSRPSVGEAEAAAAADVVRSGWLVQGPRVEAFEQQLSERLGGRHVVAVGSGTAALHLQLLAEGIGPGDDVIVPSLSFVATAACVRYVGARPVFADVDAATMNLSLSSVAAAWTPRTRAVLLVHQVGTPCPVAPLADLCERRGAVLLEDAACALGTGVGGRAAGTLATSAAFSFHPRKIITTGEGGAYVCADDERARRVRLWRQHGMSRDAATRAGGRPGVAFVELGYNYRMTDGGAAMGLVQLGRLDAILDRRRAQALRYLDALAPLRERLGLPDEPQGSTHSWQSFVVRLRGATRGDRDQLVERLRAAGVGAAPGIQPIHREPAFAAWAPDAQLPETDAWAREAFMLPIFDAMTEAEQDAVVEAVVAALASM